MRPRVTLPQLAEPGFAAERLAFHRANYAEARSNSLRNHRLAAMSMPGGNTRSVLHLDPFPITIVKGAGDEVVDLDGFSYIDAAGEFSAGLYGHSDPAITAAQHAALSDGLVLSGANRYEAEFSSLLVERFPSIERVRFCNSGTEANLIALMTAMAFTGRRAVMAIRGGYHGSVMIYPENSTTINVPLDVSVCSFNDINSAKAVVEQVGESLAAILIEPLLGAGGNIPADPEFLAYLRGAATKNSALLIFDEVKTSRLGPAGLQGHYGVIPDLTTLGKYLGGGLPCAAFGGRADIMDRFDPRRPDTLKHAGTFNNNVLSFAGGLVGMRDVFTPTRAAEFLSEGEDFREGLDTAFAARGLPVCTSGIGSILSLYPGEKPPRQRLEGQEAALAQTLRTLVYFNALERGLMLTPRGDIYLSLPMSAARRDSIRDILVAAVEEEFGFLTDQPQPRPTDHLQPQPLA